MVEFKGFLIGALIIGLFAFCMISFGGFFASNNELNTSVSENAYLKPYFNNINQSLATSYSNVNATGEAIMKEGSDSKSDFTSAGFVFRSILSAGSTFLNMGVGVFKYTTEATATALGLNTGMGQIIFGVISAVILIVLIFGVWKWWREGA